MDQVTTVPAARADETMINSYGDPIPRRLVAEKYRLEDRVVRQLIQEAEDTRGLIALFKTKSMDDVLQFMETLRAIYRVRKGGLRGGTKLESYDGLMRVEISTADSMTFGPELQIAKRLIDECIREWSAGADEKIQVIVNDAFRVGKDRTIQVDRVLALRRLDIADEKWLLAMNAIASALRPLSSRSYIRFYKRDNPEARFEQIVLDMSRV